MSTRMRFIKATGGKGWKTLEELVGDLDRAGYWKDRPERSAAEKKRHVRKMLATLVFRAAPATGAGPSDDIERHVFVSAIKTDDSGGLTRRYKQFFGLTRGEMRDVLEDAEINRAYREGRGDRAGARAAEGRPKGDEEGHDEGAFDALLPEGLTEETMRRAWPGVGRAGRRGILLAASIQHRRSEEALLEISERCRAEGFDIQELLDDYLRAAGVSPAVDPQEANRVARSAAEYFKVAEELEGLSVRKIYLEAFLRARANTVEEFAEKEGISPEEAAAFFAGGLKGYADEFQGVLEAYKRDSFGWTLDEHLQFAIERR